RLVEVRQGRTGLAPGELDPHRLVGHQPGAGAPHSELVVEPCRLREVALRVPERHQIPAAGRIALPASGAPEGGEGTCPGKPLVGLRRVEDLAGSGLGAAEVTFPDLVAGALDLDRAGQPAVTGLRRDR